MANIRINGKGLFFSAQNANITSSAQTLTSGFFITNQMQASWTGTGLSYTTGVSLPTAGTITSITVKNGLGLEQFSISNLNYLLSSSDDWNKLDQVLINMVSGNDNWTGSAVNDLFALGSGSDTYDGGAGTDTVLMNIASSYFSVNLTKNGMVTTIVAPGTAVNGLTDTFTNIERLQFTDKTLAIDIDGNAGQAYRLYQAAFNRIPDKAGLGYWIGQLDSGAETLNHAAAGFVNSVEFKKLYGDNITDNAFMTALYNNVLHRNPDQAGFDYWNGRIKDGMTRPDILASFSESAENFAQVIGQISHGIEFIPYG
ncbi:DUF4214 domain-containing protein [Undibacterium sp. Ji83W]|uniref:DUF4214 domain-containing protein n=1 Tax=Undibacterium sp. Ji83W TaxID=3413043 RepID=UPI003BEF65D3